MPYNYEDVKISGIEFSRTKIAIIADVLKDCDNNYDFYIGGKCLIVKNQYGSGIIRGLKRSWGGLTIWKNSIKKVIILSFQMEIM